MKYEYIGEQSITIHGIGEAGARMSEIELPEPDVQETAEFMRGMLVDGGCYTAEQVRAAILAERERAAGAAWLAGMAVHDKALGLPTDAREVVAACTAAIIGKD